MQSGSWRQIWVPTGCLHGQYNTSGPFCLRQLNHSQPLPVSQHQAGGILPGRQGQPTVVADALSWNNNVVGVCTLSQDWGYFFGLPVGYNRTVVLLCYSGKCRSSAPGGSITEPRGPRLFLPGEEPVTVAHAFLPWCLTHQVLLGIRAAVNCEVSLIAPCWSNQPLFLLLLNLLIGEQFMFPIRGDCLSQVKSEVHFSITQ